MGSTAETKIIYSGKVPLYQKLSPTNLFSNYFSHPLSTSSIQGSSGNNGFSISLGNSAAPPLASSSGQFQYASSFPVSNTFVNVNSDIGWKNEMVLDIERIYSPSFKRLEFRIRDLSDPLLYFTCSLDETLFNQLSVSQNWIVSFDSFPSKFIEFINLIQHHSKDPTPSYFLQLIRSEQKPSNVSSTSAVIGSTMSAPSSHIFLNVVEVSSFKQINHISLPMNPPTDAEVKERVASLHRQYQAEVQLLQNRLLETERVYSSQLKDTVMEKDKLKLEFERKGMKWEDHLSSLQSNPIMNENIIAELKFKFEREQKELEFKHKEKISSLTERVERLENTNTYLTNIKSSLENTINDLSKKCQEYSRMNESLGKELRNYTNVLTTSTGGGGSDVGKNGIGGSESGSEAEVYRLRVRVKELETDILVKEEKVILLRAENKTLTERELKASNLVSKYEQQIHELENATTKATGEITKANDIIIKLQSELRAAKSKSKSKNAELENVTKDKKLLKDSLEKYENEINDLRQQNSQKMEELRIVEEREREKSRELKDLKEKYDKNEKVIDWLHRQLSGDKNAAPIGGAKIGTLLASGGNWNRFKIPTTVSSALHVGKGEHMENSKNIERGGGSEDAGVSVSDANIPTSIPTGGIDKLTSVRSSSRSFPPPSAFGLDRLMKTGPSEHGQLSENQPSTSLGSGPNRPNPNLGMVGPGGVPPGPYLPASPPDLMPSSSMIPSPPAPSNYPAKPVPNPPIQGISS